MSDYLTTLDARKAKRLANLTASDGWLNIIGRFWLAEGTVTVGTAEDNDIVLSAGPAHVGSITQAPDGKVTYTPADGGAPKPSSSTSTIPCALPPAPCCSKSPRSTAKTPCASTTPPRPSQPASPESIISRPSPNGASWPIGSPSPPPRA
ncbi:hypothetical protein N8D56_17635 [Devosia sp. A8/3-2]|nr:hypothetical protein N8D56_17635 [Devosia sp. A8/3-2]